MAARATASAKPPAASRRQPPRRPALPQGGAPVIIGIPVPAEGEELPEPERVPVFQIGDDVYTMLAESPPTLGIETLDYADRKGGAGYGEIYLLREMLGSEGLNALLNAGKKRWITKAQYEAITRRVMAVALGVEEEDLPNR